MTLFGLDTLAASSLMILASSSPYGDVCAKNQKISINVTPIVGKAQYNTSSGLKDVQGASLDVRDPYGFRDSATTYSYTRSKIVPKVSISLGYESMHRRGRSVLCAAYKSVSVQISLESSVTMASEVYKDECMRNALIKHEQRHVALDREIVNKYAAQIGQTIAEEARGERAVLGPVLKRHKQDLSNQMRRYLQKLIELELQKMSLERNEKHRDIEASTDYNDLGKECTEFQDKKKALHKSLEP